MKKTFIILDWSWFVFRAYYGMPSLHDDQWRPVQAIYWFFRMLFHLLKQKPDYFLIAWDSPKQTIRKQEFEEYKANRTKLPNEFKFQMWSIKTLVDQCWFSCLEVPWYEADDIIWTLTNNTTDEEDMICKIVSSDKDLKQLINNHVVVYDWLKDEETNYERFKIDFGYEPPLIVDYLSLVWDASDNIKWVMGIWAKWAARLVKEYGWLDEIYENIEHITGATKDKLIQGKESAYQSKKLIKLMDVPSAWGYDHTEASLELDFDHLKKILVEEWKFTGLQKVLKELKNEIQGGTQLGLFG